MKTLHYSSLLLQLFVIVLAFVHDPRIGVLILLLSIAIALRLRLRAKLGVFENIDQMTLFQEQEKAARLHLYRSVPHHICTFCGQSFKKHKLTTGDSVICPEVKP